MKFRAICLRLALALAGASHANDWEQTVSQLRETVAKRYLSTVPSGFGANLNTGWAQKAPPASKLAFSLQGGVVAMASLLRGDGKLEVQAGVRFDSLQAREIADRIDTTGMGPAAGAIRDSLTELLRREAQPVRFAGPTILGSMRDTIRIYVSERSVAVPTGPGTHDTVTIPEDTITVRNATGLLGDVRGVLGRMQALPLFVPQLTVGTVYGTNLTLRWLHGVDVHDRLGTVGLFGAGVQHNPAVWMERRLPVNLGVGAFAQRMEVADLMIARSWALALSASRTFGRPILNVTPYGGVQFESARMDFSYAYEAEDGSVTEPIRFTMRGENRVRATAGLSLRILALNLNTDVSMARHPSASLGVMVGI